MNRSACWWVSSYASGLGRPSPSTAAHDVTGQQSLSCQMTEPMHTGACERRWLMPRRSARAWLSCIAQCQASMSEGSSKCGSSPTHNLVLPSPAFWWATIPGDSGVIGSS